MARHKLPISAFHTLNNEKFHNFLTRIVKITEGTTQVTTAKLLNCFGD